MGRREQILELMERAHEAELAFVDGLTDEERSAAGAADAWAPKDVIAHLAYWRVRRIRDAQAVAAGSPPGPEADFDEENRTTFERYRESSWPEVLALAEEAYQRLRRYLGEVDEETLELPWRDERAIWMLLANNGIVHPYLHLADQLQKKGEVATRATLLGEMARAQLRLDDSLDWQATGNYNLACHYALLGEKKEAVAALRAALALNSELRKWSREDRDLVNLHGHPGYEALYEE